MKYKVSVIKKIAFLVMTMALAVAMVACSGAAGKPGPAGPKVRSARSRHHSHRPDDDSGGPPVQTINHRFNDDDADGAI